MFFRGDSRHIVLAVIGLYFLFQIKRERNGWLSPEPTGFDRYRVQLCLLKPFLSSLPREEERADKAQGKPVLFNSGCNIYTAVTSL